MGRQLQSRGSFGGNCSPCPPLKPEASHVCVPHEKVDQARKAKSVHAGAFARANSKDEFDLVQLKRLGKYLSAYTLQQMEATACLSDCTITAEDGTICCSIAMLGSASKVLRWTPAGELAYIRPHEISLGPFSVLCKHIHACLTSRAGRLAFDGHITFSTPVY